MGIMRNMKGNNTEDSSDAEKLAKKAAKIAKMAIKATVKAVIGILHFLGPIGIALVCLLSFLVFFSFDEINDQTAKDTEKSVTEALKSVGVEDLISSVDIKGSEGEGYYFDFNDKQLREEITKKLHKNDVSLGDLGMKKIDTLMEFIKAEITTQLPNISQDPENIKTDGDKLQGAIKFKRQTINKAIGQVVGNNVEERNQNYYLTYVSQDTFKGYVDNGKEEALQHFTLDDKRQLITATWSYSDSEGTIIKQDSAKEYRTKVQKYTMPYQYPLAFLLEGQNVKFAEKLAGLAADSDITITLLDNVTMNLVKTIVTEYSQQAVSYTTVDNQTNERQTTERAEGEIIQQGNPTVTETTNENATSELQVTNVDAWCVQYKKEYILEENDTGYISSGVDRQIGDYRGPISTVISFDEQRTVWKNVYSRTIVDTEIQNRNITYKYKENPDVEAKVEGNVDKFVNLMKEYKNSVMHNLQSDKAENLLDILAGSEKTNNMVELTKWLLQQCSKKFKYGLTEFDFSEYEPDSFTQVSFGGGDILQYYLKAWENGTVTAYLNDETSYNSYVAKYITQDKTKYICYTDVNGTRNFGYGVCHWTGRSWNNVDSYASVGINIKDNSYNQLGVSTLDVSIVDKVMQIEIDNFKNYVKTKISQAGIQLEENQINALTSVAYQYGNIGNFTNVYPQYGNTEQFRNNFVVNGYKPFVTGYKGISYEIKRANANWKSFHENIYIDQSGNVIDVSQFAGGTIVEQAVQLHQYLRNNGYTYAQAGITVPNLRGRTIDCSSYVSWTLVNAGVSGFSEGMYQWTSSTFTSNPLGWQEVSVDNAQPGDIVTYSGHVEIIAGPGDAGRFLVYNCGGNSSINSNGQAYGVPESSMSSHSKTSIRKILRTP